MAKKVDKLIEAEKFLAGMNAKERETFEKEIKSYNIAVMTEVRGCGSHDRRCLWDICGKPMIQWGLEAAKGSKYINKIAVITEDKEIHNTVEKLGFLVIPRASYTAKDYPVDYRVGYFRRGKPRSLIHSFLDAQKYMPEYAVWHLLELEGYCADVRLRLDANWPMATTELIDTMLEMAFAVPQTMGVQAVHFITDSLRFINYERSNVFPIFPEPFDRQAKFPICYFAGITVSLKPSQLDSQGGIGLPYPVSLEMALDVHDEEDLFLARNYMQRRLEGGEKGSKQ